MQRYCFLLKLRLSLFYITVYPLSDRLTFSRSQLFITRFFTRKRKVRRIYHRRHGLRTEEVVKAAVVPDYPEAILLRYLIAYLLSACSIFGYYAMELLTVKLCVLAKVHLVVNYAEHRKLYSVPVL